MALVMYCRNVQIAKLLQWGKGGGDGGKVIAHILLLPSLLLFLAPPVVSVPFSFKVCTAVVQLNSRQSYLERAQQRAFNYYRHVWVYRYFRFQFWNWFFLSVLPLVVSQSVVFSGGTERRFSFCLVVAARAACAPCDTQSLFFLPFSYRFFLVVYSIKYVQRVADFCRLFTGARLLGSWMMMAHWSTEDGKLGDKDWMQI